MALGLVNELAVAPRQGKGSGSDRSGVGWPAPAKAMNIPAVIQTIVLAIGIWRSPQYTAFLLSLAASLVFLWVSPRVIGNGPLWERAVWLPCAIMLIPLQAVACLEAFFRFGRRQRFAPSVAISMAIFSAVAVIAFVVWPHGDMVGQVVQVARYQRVGSCVFLLLACGWYGSICARDLFLTRDGAHLLLLAAWMTTWMVPIIRPIPPTWAEWMRADWMVIARCVVLVAWAGAVAGRKYDGQARKSD